MVLNSLEGVEACLLPIYYLLLAHLSKVMGKENCFQHCLFLFLNFVLHYEMPHIYLITCNILVLVRRHEP